MRSVFQIARAAGRTPIHRRIAREFVEAAAEDQAKEKMFGRDVHTGTPTRGGIIYSGLKGWYNYDDGPQKIMATHELQTHGISPTGASMITEGQDPGNQVDRSVFVRVSMDNFRLLDRTNAGQNVANPETATVSEVMAAALVPSGSDE